MAVANVHPVPCVLRVCMRACMLVRVEGRAPGGGGVGIHLEPDSGVLC